MKNQSNIAKNIARNNQFYYGWVIIAVASLSVFFSGPGQTYFFAAFIDSYIQDFKWNRSAVSGLYSIATLMAGLLLFFVGRLTDKYGAKKIILIVAALLGASCIWNSFISGLWMLFLGFFISRLTGQGSMTLIPYTVVPQWFIKKRAFAFSLLSIGGVIGSAMIPPLNTLLIDFWGWSNTWRLWAALLWFFFIPIVLIFHFDKPEDLGLCPEEELPDPANDNHLTAENTLNKPWTLKKVLRARTFWFMLFCQLLFPMISTGVVFHFVSILGVKGIPATSSSLILSIIAIVGFPATFAASYLFERVKTHHATALMVLLQLIGLIVLVNLRSITSAILFAVFHGLTMGLHSIASGVIWPDYFGKEQLGGIRGLVMTFIVIGAAFGPIPFGIAFDTFGRYTEAIIFMMVFPAFGIIAALLSPPPVKQ